MSIRVYIGVGSNLGEPTRNVTLALARLAKLPELTGARPSPLFESPPWGDARGGAFVNAVLEAYTTLGPRELLGLLLRLEREAGREWERAAGANEPRTLDLDLLFFGAAVVDEANLTVPHPRAHLRRFVLEPLCDLHPDLVHPRVGRTVRDLLSDVTDPAVVTRLPRP